MSDNNRHYDQLNSVEAIPLLSPSLRGPLEEAVSEYQEREWRVSRANDMSDFACSSLRHFRERFVGGICQIRRRARRSKAV